MGIVDAVYHDLVQTREVLLVARRDLLSSDGEYPDLSAKAEVGAGPEVGALDEVIAESDADQDHTAGQGQGRVRLLESEDMTGPVPNLKDRVRRLRDLTILPTMLAQTESSNPAFQINHHT